MQINDGHLNVHSWLVVITFMVVIVLVIHPIRIPLPIPRRTRPRTLYRDKIGPSAPTQQPADDAASSTTVTALPPLETSVNVNTVSSNATTNNNHCDDSDSNSSRIKQGTIRSKFKFPYHITLNIATAPVLGVLFLLATQSISGQSVKNGIIGEPTSGIEPYAVMILFFSLAYICISLDMTGVLQYAAFWISKRGAGSGQRIFLYFFLLSSIMSGLTSNDVVILTMTPFLVYFSHAVELITPVAFLMAEVQTANIASMALYIGNLTNVVACQAYKVSFLEYSAWMLIPTFASIAACYAMLRINFRHEKYIPNALKSPDVDPRSCLIDPAGAIFGLCILACSLICLIGTSFAHVSVWIVTGPFALLTLCRDFWYDYQGKFKGHHSNSLGPAANTALETAVVIDSSLKQESIAMGGIMNRMEQGLPEIAIPEQGIVHPTAVFADDNEYDDEDKNRDRKSTRREELTATNRKDDVSISMGNSTADINERQDAGHPEQTKLTIPPAAAAAAAPAVEELATTTMGTTTMTLRKRRRVQKTISRFEQRFPLLFNIFIRMPWAILPFTFSMFIMVEGLSDSGWIAIFANWATRLVPNYIAATYAIGFISVLLCNIFNNVPMTILVARILQHPNFVNSPQATPEVVKGCLFALIVGSNLGACTTLISSLAGLMWDSVLRSKSSEVGFLNFFRWNMGVMPMVIFVALSVVVIELSVIY